MKHKNAFAAFSLGSENCIGKNCTSAFFFRRAADAPALTVRQWP